jgi:hypothetical protein
VLPIGYKDIKGYFSMSINTKNKWFIILASSGVLFLFGILCLIFLFHTDRNHLVVADTDYNHQAHGYNHDIKHGNEHADINNPEDDWTNKRTKHTEDKDELFQDLKEIKTKDIDEGVEELPDYFPIHEDSIGQMLSEIEVRNKNLVSQKQLMNLQSVLKKNILAYKYGIAKEILENRLRAPYSIKPEATRWHIKILKRHYIKGDEALPSDPDKIMRLLVSRRYHGENGSGYKDLYNELSVNGSHFYFHQTNKMPMSIRDHLHILSDTGARTFYNGVITPHPSIKYRNSPQKVLQKYRKLLYVDVSIAASDSEGLKYSRLKRYYWSEDNHVWLPMEILSLRAKDRKADEFF